MAMLTTKKKSKLPSLLLGLILCLVSFWRACLADDYQIEKSVLNGGIQEIASETHGLQSSLGEAAIGNMAGGEYILMGGFWSAFTYFISGDANNDETVDIGDVIYLVNYLFMGGFPPPALPTGDVNCDGGIDVGDLAYLINYLFIGCSPPLMCDP